MAGFVSAPDRCG